MYPNKDIERVGSLKKPTYIQDMSTQDINRIERYIRDRFRTGQAFDNLINNIKEKRKKKYMSIKVKAALTVVMFFVGMIGTMLGLISIPEEWIVKYGTPFLEVAIVIAALAFSYKVAYDYYVAKEELKEIQERREINNQRLDEELKSIDTHTWILDDNGPIRPPQGRRNKERMPKNKESNN